MFNKSLYPPQGTHPQRPTHTFNIPWSTKLRRPLLLVFFFHQCDLFLTIIIIIVFIVTRTQDRVAVPVSYNIDLISVSVLWLLLWPPDANFSLRFFRERRRGRRRRKSFSWWMRGQAHNGADLLLSNDRSRSTIFPNQEEEEEGESEEKWSLGW